MRSKATSMAVCIAGFFAMRRRNARSNRGVRTSSGMAYLRERSRETTFSAVVALSFPARKAVSAFLASVAVSARQASIRRLRSTSSAWLVRPATSVRHPVELDPRWWHSWFPFNYSLLPTRIRPDRQGRSLRAWCPKRLVYPIYPRTRPKGCGVPRNLGYFIRGFESTLDISMGDDRGGQPGGGLHHDPEI